MAIHPGDRPERRTERRAPRSTRPAAARITVGSILEERYRVLGIIGQGGMGTVYEAEHLNIGRRVALKILKPEHAQKGEAVARLRHEARVVSQIGHPNICEIFDIGQFEDGSPYLVMERLRGETLAQRIERGPLLRLDEIADIMVQVLAALEAAHRKNVIHRDMKPDNIFLAQRQIGIVAKILDFGISKANGPDELPHHLTRTGMVMGTPYYMAPEQAMGERMLDGRVDVWGVAVAIYEALTGQRPFVARNYNALLVQILTVTPRPILELRPDLPPAFGEVMRRALEKRRDGRFSTAKELSEALSAFRPPRTTPPRRATQRMLPRVAMFGAEDSSSFTSSEDEPTQEIEAKARKTFVNEEMPVPPVAPAPVPTDDETPTFEENDPTVVDTPSFSDSDFPSERRRR
ncbi:MAG: serine/threonine protein kinase [Polyangiaceae bacterium]|nr:serine/threonine protein kinase [Polyangiaceae bacterium]